MAFGGGSGFSFGSNNNNTQSSGFGGFGNSTSNTGTGFGATSNTGFGSTSTSTNPFGGGSGGGFGTSTGGFGSTNTTTNSLFGGNKPATGGFGTSTTGAGSLFGNNNASTGFGSTLTNTGGFGSTNNTSAFGSNNTTPSFSFGASKPAFGAANTGGTLFGQGGAGTTGGFGSTNAFGSAGSGTALSSTAVPPCEGTAVTPFSPTVEQDGTSSNKVSYQSLNFQPPYQKYSFEELRLADYNAGRRFGNGNGQAGAFGSSTFGGFSNNTVNSGFGSNNSNPFGTSSSTTLGGNTSTTGGFGGGLFGNNTNKPAGTGLFGQQTSSTTGGGLFGTSNNSNTTNPFGGNTSAGFGSTNNNTTNSIFNNNQNQSKPSLFGGTSNNTAGGFSFGNNTSNSGTGSGIFGTSNNTNPGFGNNANTSNSLFSNNNQNQQKPGGIFGGSGTTGGFGTSTTQGQTAGGLFGNANTTAPSGGLFGNTNNQSNTNTLFGGSGTSNTTGGGLFSNNNNQQQQKPSLFGGTFGTNNNNNNNTTGSSLFNTNNNNQNQTGLFGNSSTGGGFGFGNSNNKPTPTGLFGSTANNNQSTGLFGSTNNNAAGGMFGQSQNSLQNSMQQQDGPKHASQTENSPFTQSSIWTGLPQATPQNSAPLLTPLSASTRLKENASKPPLARLLSQSRYNTPPRRPGQGYGFTYSTYGTPNSAASTPGTGNLAANMYNSRGFTGGSFGRSLHKSFSSSSLRPSYTAEPEIILSPGAFTPGSSRYSSGSIRRLTIDRSLKSDLFSRPAQSALPPPPPATTTNDKFATNGTANTLLIEDNSPTEQPHKLKKRVSFDKDVTAGSKSNSLNGETGALVRTESDDETESGNEPQRVGRGKTVNGDSQSGRGKELTTVPEDRESDNIFSAMKMPSDVQARADPEPGAYYMKPSRAELSKLPRAQLQQFKNFVVGRKGCGHVTFNGPVDLTSVPLDDVFDKIVEIRLRSITVYPEASTKPPPGKGLNVPSTLYIENSWPRARNMPSSATSGPIYEKHINRLKKMSGTVFLNYDNTTGVWTFTVPHYTRYGLDYDDDEENESELSPPPESIEDQSPPGGAGDVSAMELDGGLSEESSDQDDTFAFKQKMVPGSFGRQSLVDEGPELLQDECDSDHSIEQDEETSERDLSMAGTFPEPAPVDLQSPIKPILKPRMGTPGRPLLDLDGDWADQLQRTISPRKQNREALREMQSKVLLDRVYEPIQPKKLTGKADFRNSLDIMNSIFGRHEEKMVMAEKGKKGLKGRGVDFEFPYAKRPKLFDGDLSEMSEVDKAFHASFKPKWTGTNELTYRAEGVPMSSDGWTDKQLVGDELEELIVSKLSEDKMAVLVDMQTLHDIVSIQILSEVPFAKQKSVPFSVYADRIQASQAKSGLATEMGTEYDLYELLHVLFDDFEDEFTSGLTSAQKTEFEARIKRDRLTNFLGTRVWRRHLTSIKEAERRSPEEAALLHLTTKNIQGACKVLRENKNYSLMLLIAQLESVDVIFQDEMTAQIAAWGEQDIISEMSDPIRALYSILSGNTSVVRGKAAGPVEDRASTFAISDRFELDWLQAFCLCLWYGRAKNGRVEESIAEFAKNLDSGIEPAHPRADGTAQESPMWVLLKLYAATQAKGAGLGREVEAPTLPQDLNALSTPFDCRTTFAVHCALTSRIPKLKVDVIKADKLAEELSFQMAASGKLVDAAYALLHLSDHRNRRESIKDLLSRFAATLPDQSADGQSGLIWRTLTDGLKVSKSWIYEAKALHARSQNESEEELDFLILAELWDVAHECLCRRVAPRLVIDEDWEVLREMIGRFGEHVQDHVHDWAKGGGVYADFVAVVGGGRGAVDGRERYVVLKRLQASLAEMGARFKKMGLGDSLGSVGTEVLEERVCVMEMGRAVAGLMAETGLGADVLGLPLTADVRLRETMGVADMYWRAAVAAAR